MSQKRPQSFDTRVVHAGEAPDPSTGAHGVPLYGSSTYAFRSYEQVEGFEAGQVPHFVYARYGNPTVRCFELKMADLEGAEAAAAAATGMAAIAATLTQVTAAGGHLIAADELYNVSGDFLCQDLPAQGVTVSRLDVRDLVAVEAAFTPQTRAIFVESLSNPRLKVADLGALAEIAHGHGALLIVDNTFLSPALLRPIEHGADLVLHSATKYLSGTGQALGGVVAGRREVIGPIAARLARQGGNMTPFAAWLLLIGIKTLPLRMERHSATTARLAAFLAEHPAVATVNYPSLPGHPGADVVARSTGERFGGVLSFTLKGGPVAARACLNALQLCTIAVSLGDSSTLVWPFDSSGEGLIRVAVGLEDPADLEADLAAGLDRAAQHAVARLPVSRAI
ncbi:MAG: methionine-gamma-lyase [Thermomicrobiales bacterium]|nr:methionine-gamma-lyase [Thermomicrobiales bacterium]